MKPDRSEFERQLNALASAPDNASHLRTFCISFQTSFPREVAAFLTARLAQQSSPAMRVFLLWLLAQAQDMSAPGWCEIAASPGEMHFLHARDVLQKLQAEASALADLSPTPPVLALQAECYAASADLNRAEDVLRKLRASDRQSTTSAANFSEAFHRDLLTAGKSEDLPVVRYVQEPSPDASRIVYVAADIKYFERFGWPLVFSFAAHEQANAELMLHVFDASEDEISDVLRRLKSLRGLRFGLSTEATGLRTEHVTEAARVYYHAVRYLRLWQFRQRYSAAQIFLLDADTIFNSSSEHLFQLLQDVDLVLYMNASRPDMRNRVMACVVGFGATSPARTFLERVAAYLGSCRGEARWMWGVDQIALYAVLMNALQHGPELRIKPVPENIVGDTDRHMLWQPDRTRPPSERLPAAVKNWMVAMNARLDQV